MSKHNKFILPKELRGQFTVHKEIGKGSSSVVRICRDKVTGEEFVVKIIDKTKNDIDAMNEVNILKELNHANIIKYVAHEDTHEKLFLVTEYIKGPTIMEALEKRNFGDFSRQDVTFIIVQLMNGLSYLHSLDIIHRDISPLNLFVEYVDHKISALKIGDFGFAAKLKDSIQTGNVGTFGFIAPEMYGMMHNFKVDVYSAGHILMLISTKVAFTPPWNQQASNLIRIEMLDQNLLDLIRKMTEVNPIIRYSPADVLNHTWIRENLQ